MKISVKDQLKNITPESCLNDVSQFDIIHSVLEEVQKSQSVVDILSLQTCLLGIQGKLDRESENSKYFYQILSEAIESLEVIAKEIDQTRKDLTQLLAKNTQTLSVLNRQLSSSEKSQKELDRNINALRERIDLLTGLLEDEKEKRREAQETSITDPLTGLFNRREFEKRFEESFSRAKRGINGGILILDIDYFKKINDQFGHSAGDAVLKAFASKLKGIAREIDVIARWGGEEFVILLENPESESGIYKTAERIREEVESMEIHINSSSIIKVTVSIGAKYFTAEDISTENIFECADSATYTAKNLGRNNVQLYTPSMKKES